MALDHWRYNMHRFHHHHSLVLLVMLPLLLLPLLTKGCVEEERQALLEFKRAALIEDPFNFLESWNSSSSSQEDCCGWLGIKCRWDGEGHVIIRLELLFAGLSGKISPSLLSLKHLEYLDLSWNDFLPGTPIPAFIGNFSNLTTLNLANAGFGGAIPPQLGMLRNLEELYLGGNHFEGAPIPAFIGNLSKLIRLSLGSAGFGGAIPPQLGMLRNLEELDLGGNHFEGAPIPAFIGNFSNLTTLILEGAGFGGHIPPQLGMLRNLENLYLSGSDFLQGTLIPPFIGNFSNLISLHLERAGFGGHIPPQLGMLRKLQYLSIYNTLDSGGEKTSSSYPQLYVEDFRWISNLSSLETLEFRNLDMGRASDWESSLSRCPLLQELTLYSCNLTSSLHGGILPSQSSGNGGFASLESLDLSHNKQLGKSFFPTWLFSLNNLREITLANCSLDGVLTEHHFRSNFTSLLTTLLMSNNPHLHIQIAPDWVPPFNLSFLDLSSCQVGPRFPLWLRTQQNLQELYLSCARLQDSLPTWIWGFSSTLRTVDLSKNQLYDVVPDFSFSILERTLDLSSNDFSRTTTLDLSSNNFSGHLPALARSSSVGYLNLSYNSFSGCLSRLICHNRRTCSVLEVLDLDNNLLSGNMSDCWDGCTRLKLVRISNNYLTGPFSNSLAHLGYLSSLHLRNNSLSGTLLFLEKHNWTNLITLDLGVNKFYGNLKSTCWKKFPKLRFLILDSNEISGIIPREICNLENLQILNLANNNLSETIPKCFTNFQGMMMKPKESSIVLDFAYYENLQLFTRGRLDDYSEILGLVTLLDISNNHLSGEIPKELINLIWLYSLNLSRNQLTGPIPINIGDMRGLNSLDLSINRLSGEIPQTITQLTSLDHLDVSHNKLSGKIPFGPQLQLFNSSSYIGNTLCGEPLQEKCDNVSSPTKRDSEEYKGSGDDYQRLPFYVGVTIGFGAGTSAIFITLLFRHSWRIAYFRFIESILNKLF